jgi:uncharacterized protein YbjT (DUF2867 family)
MPNDGTIGVEFVATADVAKKAAELIEDTSWTGRAVVELLGPETLTHAEAAKILGEAIGKDVGFVEITSEQFTGAMTAAGISDDIAASYLELYDGLKDGSMATEGTPETATTTFRTFATDVFAPAYKAMTG